MKSKFLVSFLTLFAILFFVIGCNNPATNPSSTPTDSGEISLAVPKLPASLSGNSEDAISTRAISRSFVFDFNTLFAEYGNFIVVPEISNNYHGWIDQIIPEMNNTINIPNYQGLNWTDFVKDQYTRKLDAAAFGVLVYANDDYSQFELYQEIPGGEVRYLRSKKTDSYTHSMLLMFHTSGNMAHDSVEIIETENKIYSKCIRIHWMDGSNVLITTPEGKEVPPNHNLQHFVGITDKTSASGKTTGLRANDLTQNTAGERTTFSEYNGPFLTFENGGSEFLIGYFNDSDLYVNSATDTGFVDAEYTDPADLEFLFTQGLGINDIFNLDLSTFGEGGFDFKTWDYSSLN